MTVVFGNDLFGVGGGETTTTRIHHDHVGRWLVVIVSNDDLRVPYWPPQADESRCYWCYLDGVVMTTALGAAAL